MKQITIVSDPGIDDIVGLALLAKADSRASCCLVASFGNAPVIKTGRNAQEFIACMANNWSYHQGSAVPMNGVVEHPWPDYFHGADGLWGVHPDVSTTNISHVSLIPPNDTLISLSPMTDAEKILGAGTIKEAIVMGGAFTIPGNETKYAETNIAFDPDAAAHFFKMCSGTQVRVVPLDMTRKVFWSLKTVQSIPESSTKSVWLIKLLLAWFTNYNHDKEKDFNLHDPLAVYLSLYPEKAKWKRAGVRVITKGAMRGRTVLDAKNPEVNIAWQLDNPDKIAQDIFSMLFL